jgi:aspartate/tyrosine/aromatic aminotransferase
LKLARSIAEAPAGSVFLLHACAHNPTGIDSRGRVCH